MKLFVRCLCVLSLVVVTACSGSNSLGVFIHPNHVAIDSTNDRMLISQPSKQLFFYVASTQSGIGDQPTVSEDQNELIYNKLPNVITQMAIFSTGSTSRIFIMGALLDSASNAFVLNQIRVLDFDGSTISEASFSPITISDGDSSTDETDNSFSDLIVDQSNGRIYVTDGTAGRFYAFSATDGTAAVTPITIAGSPQGMSLLNGRVYVCNSSSTASEQLVTVVNTTDFSTTTIDLDVPCTTIETASNDSGSVMAVKRSDSPQVLLRQIDTTTFTGSNEVNASTSGFNNGVLVSGAGISSSVNGLVLGRNSSGQIFGYLGESDGSIQFLTLATDLSTYSLETLSTSVTNISGGAEYTDTNGNTSFAYMVAESGALIDVEFGTTSVDVND